jgi:L-alanine-DL-glutamate epimerase-like enolase superfamily enzyme
MSRSIGPEDEARRFKELRDTKGVQAFKFRIGTSTGRDRDAWPGRTEGMITTLGSSLSGSCSLFADGNSCYTPSQAIDAGRMLENNGIVQFEEPCPYWELEWTRLVTEALHLKVTGGEQDNDLAQWRRMIQMKAVDIVQPDILYAGGLTRALRIAGMAREAGMSCIPHSANHCLVTVFTLHMMRAIPNAGEFIEFSIENEEAINKTAKELFTPHLEISDGCINLSPEPGWGIQVNESWLQTAAYQKSELPV